MTTIAIKGYSQQWDWGIARTADDLIAAMTTPPSAGRQTAIRTLHAVVASLRGKLSAFYVPAADSEQAGQLNWLAANYPLTPVNSPTFTQDRGYNGDAATSYCTTNFNPTHALDKFALNSATMGAFLLTSGVSNASAAGNSNARLGRSTGAFGSRANDGTSTTTARSNTFPAHVCWVRDNANDYVRYENGVAIATQSTASTSMFDAAFDICRVGATYTANRIAAYYFGSALTAAEVLTLHNAILAYMQTVGAA